MVDRGPLAERSALTGHAHPGIFEIITEYKYVNKMVIALILIVSILIAIPLAKWHSEIDGDDAPFNNCRKNK
jgi:hypothetical protein